MSVPGSLAGAGGDWTGEGTLYLPWRTPSEFTYASTASVRPVAKGFLRVDYTWSHEGEPHEGLLLLTDARQDGAVSAVWMDSWHQSQSFLLSAGRGDEAGGSVAVLGSYPAPPDPDWQWRTVVTFEGNRLELTMYNISPGGEEMLAVRNRYERRS